MNNFKDLFKTIVLYCVEKIEPMSISLLYEKS